MYTERTPFDAIMDLRDHYAAQPAHAGNVHWFDGPSGEGMVKLDDGQSLYCHFTAIHGIDKNGYSCPLEADIAVLEKMGKHQLRCMVLPHISPGYIGCERVVILDWIDAV